MRSTTEGQDYCLTRERKFASDRFELSPPAITFPLKTHQARTNTKLNPAQTQPFEPPA